MGKKGLQRVLKKSIGDKKDASLGQFMRPKQETSSQPPPSLRLFEDCPAWILELGLKHSRCRKADVLPTCMHYILDASIERDLDYVETFAGKANFSREMNSRGYKGNAYDLQYSSSQDVTTPIGFTNIGVGAKRVRNGGIVVLAPQCSSWPQFLCAGHTKRSHDNIFGNEDIPEVFDANITAILVGWLVSFLYSRGVHILMEQPADSLLPHHPSIELALRATRAQRFFTWLGAFGNALYKPTALFTTMPSELVSKYLVRSKPQDERQLSTTLVGHNVSGKPILDSSAAYTVEFACAIVDTFVACDSC